jgi:hypothetical protein
MSRVIDIVDIKQAIKKGELKLEVDSNGYILLKNYINECITIGNIDKLKESEKNERDNRFGDN